MKISRLLLTLVLAAFTLSVGLPLAEAIPAKPKTAQVAKGKAAKKAKAKKKSRKKNRKAGKQKNQNQKRNRQEAQTQRLKK